MPVTGDETVFGAELDTETPNGSIRIIRPPGIGTRRHTLKWRNGANSRRHTLSSFRGPSKGAYNHPEVGIDGIAGHEGALGRRGRLFNQTHVPERRFALFSHHQSGVVPAHPRTRLVEIVSSSAKVFGAKRQFAQPLPGNLKAAMQERSALSHLKVGVGQISRHALASGSNGRNRGLAPCG